MSGRGGRRGGGGEGHEGADERWLLPYADMITLLLGLFIVLFAMSSIDAKQFDNVRRSLSQTFNGEIMDSPGAVLDGSTGALDPEAANLRSADALVTSREESSDAVNHGFAAEQARLETAVRQQGLQGKVDVAMTERGIIVRLSGDAFFRSGSAELRPSVERGLRTIATDVLDNRRQIAIEGHTDGAPIGTTQFPDNETLSWARANSVYRFFAERGVPRTRMETRAYADTRPLVKPPFRIAPMARNRRVEIMILAPGANAGADVPRTRARNGDGPALPDVTRTPAGDQVATRTSRGPVVVGGGGRPGARPGRAGATTAPPPADFVDPIVIISGIDP